MAELELADWKHLRSFRLIAVDPHAGGTSFVDLAYRRPSNGGAPAGLLPHPGRLWVGIGACGWPLALLPISWAPPYAESVLPVLSSPDADRRLGGYVVIMTSPLDAR